ncbi:hypothetical protein [Pelosinus sp. sgz500959]|uniref:hypothetical protein n=1 Tax=Pelosinus sp. sgz500959 TaxID=3242472 RepID=UPI00367022AE
MKETHSNHWSIEARAFEIKYTPFSHNFWVLAHSNHPIDQLHGLAFDPYEKVTRAIGSSSDLLQVIHDSTIVWSLQSNQPTVVCISGHEVEVKNRWQAALNSIPEINELHLSYPNLWQHFYKKNSNTIFNTLGQIMGIPKPARLLSTCAPGINLIISQDIINRYHYAI